MVCDRTQVLVSYQSPDAFCRAPFLDNDSTSVRIDEGLAQTLLLKCIVRPTVRSTNSGVAEVAAFFTRLSTDRLSTQG